MQTLPALIDDADNLTLQALSATIAAELAAGLLEPGDVCRTYGLSDDQWKKLKKNPVFRNMLKEALQTLSGQMNAGKRITVKSEVALEDSIPQLHRMVHDPETGASIKIDAIKTLAQLAGRNSKNQEGGSQGTGFNVDIHIHTGQGEKPVIIEGKASGPSAD